MEFDTITFGSVFDVFALIRFFRTVFIDRRTEPPIKLALIESYQCSRIRILRFFRFKNRIFFNVFLKLRIKKSAKFSHQSVKMSSYTSLSDLCNSVTSSRSVIHSAPLLNVNVYRNFGLKIPGCYWDLGLFRRFSHTVLSCIVSCVRIYEQDVWCWWLTGTDFR